MMPGSMMMPEAGVRLTDLVFLAIILCHGDFGGYGILCYFYFKATDLDLSRPT
jgi:hypothetical protein